MLLDDVMNWADAQKLEAHQRALQESQAEYDAATAAGLKFMKENDYHLPPQEMQDRVNYAANRLRNIRRRLPGCRVG